MRRVVTMVSEYSTQTVHIGHIMFIGNILCCLIYFFFFSQVIFMEKRNSPEKSHGTLLLTIHLKDLNLCCHLKLQHNQKKKKRKSSQIKYWGS